MYPQGVCVCVDFTIIYVLVSRCSFPEKLSITLLTFLLGWFCCHLTFCWHYGMCHNNRDMFHVPCQLQTRYTILKWSGLSFLPSVCRDQHLSILAVLWATNHDNLQSFHPKICCVLHCQIKQCLTMFNMTPAGSFEGKDLSSFSESPSFSFQLLLGLPTSWFRTLQPGRDAFADRRTKSEVWCPGTSYGQVSSKINTSSMVT